MEGKKNIIGFRDLSSWRKPNGKPGILTLWLIGLTIFQVVAHSNERGICLVETISLTSQSTARSSELNELMVIPVVIHVVYRTEEENISDAQIQSQLKALNLDFRKQNTNRAQTVGSFQSLAADAAITFELASTDPSGQSTKGITRTPTDHGVFSNNDLHSSSLGGADPWSTEKYLNIWVAALAPGIIGYASHPSADVDYDGIAIHYANFGTEGTATSPYHLGRTLTHEMGHWLGLNHLWGDGGCDSDDGIADTPAQSESSNGCQLEKTSCGSLDMVQNFMDFSEDECMTFFTVGQVAVMRNSLVAHRSGLYSTRAILSSSGARVTHSTIRLKHQQGLLKIDLSSIATEGELVVYDISGQSLFRQWVYNAEKEVALWLEGYSDGVKVVQYRTLQKLFSTKFI